MAAPFQWANVLDYESRGGERVYSAKLHLWIILAFLAGAHQGHAGRLYPYAFKDVILVWKTQVDLETATELISSGQAESEEGILDPLVECWVDSGTEASMTGTTTSGLVHVQIDAGEAVGCRCFSCARGCLGCWPYP